MPERDWDPLLDVDQCDYLDAKAALVQGDCLEKMKLIPSQSVALILVDPPYHSTKKKNVYGDTRFHEDDGYLNWMLQISREWARILKLSGSVFCFCSSAMEAKLETVFSPNFNILNHIVWTKPNDPGFDGWKGKMNKDALRQWYPHSERAIFMSLAAEGNLFREPFANYIREMRLRAGLTQKDLTEKTGEYGSVNHGGAAANWEAGRNVPSESQYEKICEALCSTGKVESMLPFRDLIRPFLNNDSEPFTDVWEYPTVKPYKGKHPAEKPIELLKHVIEATTYPDDVVLDCFAGSGSTAAAALNLGRRTIAIEIEEHWCAQISSMLSVLARSNYSEDSNLDNYDQALTDIVDEKQTKIQCCST